MRKTDESVLLLGPLPPYTAPMPKILLIENDTSITESISQSLTAQGAEVTTSGDGAEGVQLVRDGEFDLIILSVELPRVSGYSVCNKLKKDPALASIPLVLMSSEATPETFAQHKKLKTRAEGYLHKPIDMAELRTLASEFASLTGVEEEDGPMETVIMDIEGLEVDLDDMDMTSSEEVSLEEDIAALDLPILPEDDGDDELLDDDVLGSLEVLDAMENGIGLEADDSDELVIDTDDDELVIDTDDDELVIDADDDDLEIDLSSDEDEVGEASEPPSPAAGSNGAAVAGPSPSSSYVSDGLFETMRSEINELRHKVRGLEETVEAKELEFSERLLEESTRARQAIGDRQKVSQLEHEMEKARSSMTVAENKAKENTSQISSLEENLQASKVGQDELSSTIERLKKELNDSKSSQDDSKSRVSELETKLEKLSQELLEGNEQRNQAREIISSMMQVLDDLNRYPNSAD